MLLCYIATRLMLSLASAICIMHYGISSGRNAQYVETTLDTLVHLIGRVVVRSDIERICLMLALAMIRFF